MGDLMALGLEAVNMMVQRKVSNDGTGGMAMGQEGVRLREMWQRGSATQTKPSRRVMYINETGAFIFGREGVTDFAMKIIGFFQNIMDFDNGYWR